MHVSQQSYTRLLLFLSLIYQAAAAPLQSSLLGTARPSLQALPSCPLPSPNTLPPNLPINADGSFILSNINLPTPPNCLFYSAPLDVDKQFLLVISSSSNVVIHVWRVGAPNEESWDSSLYLDPSGTTAFYNYVTARPNANATNTSSCAGRICNYIISVSAASGGTSQTNLQGGIGRMLEYGATAISDSLTNSQVKFFAVKCQSSNLPVQISLVSSAWVSQTIAVDMFVLPLPRPFLQTYPTTNNLLPTQFPSNQYAYISNDPAYYVDGIYLIQVPISFFTLHFSAPKLTIVFFCTGVGRSLRSRFCSIRIFYLCHQQLHWLIPRLGPASAVLLIGCVAWRQHRCQWH
jgi:hypothetical protein